MEPGMIGSSSENNHKSSPAKDTRWRCAVCGFSTLSERLPKGCPRCSSPSHEFLPEEVRTQLTYGGEPFDVLLVNGSTHRAGNTGFMLDIAVEELQKRGITFRRFNLSEYRIDHCWCCYSIKAGYCTYPCRNREDDMPAFHRMLTSTRAVIVASPINWNNMSARLKDFLDRTTCLQNLFHLKKEGLTQGKIVGILVSGHEDGGIKTAMDIFLYFQQMGYILAPFSIAYRTHGAEFDSSTDAAFFRGDEILVSSVRGVVNNVVEMMNLEIELPLREKIVPVSE